MTIIISPFFAKGPPMKVDRSQGEGSLSSADILRTRGVLQVRTSVLFGAKVRTYFRIFQNIWCVHMHKGGGGSTFRDFILSKNCSNGQHSL